MSEHFITYPTPAGSGSPWPSRELRDKASDAARDIAFRIAKIPSAASDAASLIDCRTQPDCQCLWRTPSLACGASGFSLLYSSLALGFPAATWARTAAEKLADAASASRRTPLRSWGMFHGTAGLVTAMADLQILFPEYRDAYLDLSTKLAQQILASPPAQTRSAVALGEYDVIIGASGALACLIGMKDPDGVIRDAINALLEPLIWYGLSHNTAEPVSFIDPGVRVSPYERQVYPDGYIDMGLAHGIPGPLAALCLAWQHGYRVERQHEAIQALTAAILQHVRYDSWGAYWPDRVVPDPARVRPGPYHRGRMAWCYGSPGVALALLQAALAFDGDELLGLAYNAVKASMIRPQDRARLRHSVSLCHGMSGMLLIALAFARYNADKDLLDGIDQLARDLLSECDEHLPYIVRDTHEYDTRVDCPGFLAGAASVAIGLLGFAEGLAPGVYRCLMIPPHP